MEANRLFEPSYIHLLKTGDLLSRVDIAYQRLEDCDLCAWECRTNRRLGEKGVCRTGEKARLSSYGPHMGEENPLRGWRGSGTIFFAGCNMRCVFCQNHEISQTDRGEPVEPEELAAVMLELQAYGCHNINLVSPSHVVPQIIAAVLVAAQACLRLPLVYNTGGYDSLASLKLLDGVIDIYMPDMKYADQRNGLLYSKTPHYPQINRIAVKEMHRQVGDLRIDEKGLAQHGLLVRHLVLPNNLAGTEEIVRFIAEEISTNTYLNLMDQYRPAHLVRKYPDRYHKLNRPISTEEYRTALLSALSAGLNRNE